ncbi:hypothetical protein OB236_19365 [Paenibacillus sp. WQ 127069]|uniref:HD domain-containing protein n=1 Tax=Paenibacillus baimaensis TaxID=2982185 RepID=A0ABT2UHZ4_9BACL|nr:hypothetical protein [Paenibacillus sp. WQ 127069]MCU6794269.1 hypothetical protein [Paenibacillus sp. WQ 127069]
MRRQMCNKYEGGNSLINLFDLIQFVSPYYTNKDIMHDLSHIERVLNSAKKLLKHYPQIKDLDLIIYSCYFHGFIYSQEDLIRDYLIKQGLDGEIINKIVKVSWESQKDEIPETLEGKILHDSHMVEGGRTYLIVKALCTGTARGQNLEETLNYLENNVIGKRECYLPEAKAIYFEMQQFASTFIKDLREGLKPV